ncbi:hypothetical protein BBO99_00008601 [Phytophthora kernoviae]|uniref:Uncharacterized protein n=1 Tax=Phytophthora kernoviae TaxID=325452 RepID=A0A3R7IQI8_9STRA|nr:hypothetical protein JM16_008754 [Phytophthora kernoviae]RLN45741.1 hypothetical protein BBI17_008610 [Phytophthora kernoviae]RLN75015.1 hypothetical protein BBO99_00008601 [Phytophthora kernoviae]
MITCGAPEPASIPNSPSSRINVAPSDSKPLAAGPDIVDVTGGGRALDGDPVRRTSEPLSLRTSKHVTAKAMIGATLAEARKGKKTLTKYPAGTGENSTSTRKSVRKATKGSETDVEESAVLPPAKKARKILASLDCMTFQATPTVLMAIFSGRLRSRGRMLMHFKESSEMVVLEEGSTNASFANDFSASTTLPPTSINCSTLEDILNALGQEQIRLTLLYADKLLGAVLGHLQADDPR